jgi:4-deoxy-L-threo-5-hexosulose-uronate ketol-isomerase
MESRYLPDQARTESLGTADLRKAFLVEKVFVPGHIELFHFDVDRAVIGGAMPTTAPLTLEAPPELRATYFCERREIGIINIAASGKITADDKTFAVKTRECVYIGRGTKKVTFESDDPANPAAFYLTSFPAHTTFPTTHAGLDKARIKEIGNQEEANKRRLHQYIHMEGIRSCQLVMGFTEIEPGNVWNTQPPHTHTRRCELYFYFDLAPGAILMHFMGTPEETRHLVLQDRQAIASPVWSMHFGAGTKNYRFIWAMGGENQAFDDMDHVPLTRLK